MGYLSMHTGFFKEILQEKQPLFHAIVQFNTRCNAFCLPPVPSALQHLPQKTQRALWRIGAVQSALHAGAGKAMQEKQESFWDFSKEDTRLALLEAPLLKKLALFYGTACHATAISHRLLKNDVAALQEALGTEAYLFALHRGRFCLPQVAPEPDKDVQTLISCVQHWGQGALGQVWQGWPVLLQQWTEQMLPGCFSGAENTFLQNENPWPGVKKILLREVAPQWVALFD